MKSMTAFILSIAVASAMVAMLASTGAAATPKKTVAFTASYSGTAAVKRDGQPRQHPGQRHGHRNAARLRQGRGRRHR